MKFFGFVLFVIIQLFSLPAFANDGAYLTKGGVFYPTSETKISMDKEILSFKVIDGWCEVNIAFEFNNPENTERKLTVGFQAPTAVGDVNLEQQKNNMIKDFCVQQNGVLLPYNLKFASCEDCELTDISNWKPEDQGDNGVFVYLFEITFKPGITKINHSYRFPASTSVETSQMFDYILTTGSKWSGGKIKDFTVNIDMGGNSYFYLTDVFGSKANWLIVGTGKITDQYFDNYDDGKNRMIHLSKGTLQIHTTDLAPTKNIQFGVYSSYRFTQNEVENQTNLIGAAMKMETYHVENAKTKEELRLMRNAIYAFHNLSFKSEDLVAHFSQFPWYLPDPNLKQSDIELTVEEQELLDLIKQKEKELSK